MKTRALILAVLGASAADGALAGSVDLPLQVGGAYSVPATSIKEGRFRATVRQQYDFSCGSAALSTLLTHHYGFPVTEQVVFEEMFQKGDQAKIREEGFSLLDIKQFLEQHGFQADGFEAPLDKLQSVGIPAIVLLKENGYSHFVVVKGIRNNRVLVGDPAGGTRALTRNHFESIWMNQILFVISNKQEIARFNSESDWIAAPQAPLGNGVNRNGLTDLLLGKHGPSDF